MERKKRMPIKTSNNKNINMISTRIMVIKVHIRSGSEIHTDSTRLDRTFGVMQQRAHKHTLATRTVPFKETYTRPANRQLPDKLMLSTGILILFLCARSFSNDLVNLIFPGTADKPKIHWTHPELIHTIAYYFRFLWMCSSSIFQSPFPWSLIMCARHIQFNGAIF